MSLERAPCRHGGQFDAGNPQGEQRTRAVALLTAVAMVGEIAAGWWFNSMALTADGWHMGTHALALGLAALAYTLARRYAGDPRFAFGTWKIEILASYTSALALLAVAAGMVIESAARLASPLPIAFDQATAVAILGLVVNLVCARMLHHDHGDHGDHHHDLNLRAAYVHVLTDAATSVLAIVALLGGKWLGWNWLDPLMGIVGAALVTVWAVRLIAASSRVLIDAEMDGSLPRRVRAGLAPFQVSDLHLWRVGRNAWACVLTAPESEADGLRQAIAAHPEVVHLSIDHLPAR
jgi:cation diffusion facilitator family transporter